MPLGFDLLHHDFQESVDGPLADPQRGGPALLAGAATTLAPLGVEPAQRAVGGHCAYLVWLAVRAACATGRPRPARRWATSTGGWCPCSAPAVSSARRCADRWCAMTRSGAPGGGPAGSSDASVRVTSPAADVARLPDRRRAALRHDLDVQDDHAAPRTSAGRSCARAFTTSTSTTTRGRLVPRPLPARRRRSRRAAPRAVAGGHRRVQPVLHVPPAGAGPDRTRRCPPSR